MVIFACICCGWGPVWGPQSFAKPKNHLFIMGYRAYASPLLLSNSRALKTPDKTGPNRWTRIDHTRAILYWAPFVLKESDSSWNRQKGGSASAPAIKGCDTNDLSNRAFLMGIATISVAFHTMFEAYFVERRFGGRCGRTVSSARFDGCPAWRLRSSSRLKCLV